MGRRTFIRAGAAAMLGPGAPPAVERLRARLHGRLVLPSDAGYEALRRVSSFNPATDRRPAAIVRCADAEDVARAIEAARTAGLELAVRAGGHDVLGASVCDGGIVIDLRDMARIEIDAARRRARVGPGVISSAFNAAAAARSLAPVLGCNPDVGVAGLTLGGGIGWFAGSLGAACDHLTGAQVVTADSQRLDASAAAHADLFWALRGGGGNFGVVTRLDFELAPVGEVLGGAIGFRLDTPGSMSALLQFYRDFMQAAPDPLTVELSFFVGDLPMGVALVCWSGPAEAGTLALAPLRAFARPVFDSVRPLAYARMSDRPNAGPGPAYLAWRGASLDSLPDAAAEALEAQVRAAPPGWSLGLGHFMHGRIACSAEGTTPFVRRPGQMAYFIGAGWNDTRASDQRMAWVEAAMAAMAPWSARGAYVNYLSDDRPEAVAAAYGANYARLQAVKRRCDPQNVFRGNRNIAP